MSSKDSDVKSGQAGQIREPRYEKVETWFDLVALEHEVLELWKETDAFNKLRKKNAGKENFSFLDGPITANNPMGVHHAWGRTYKDLVQRFHAMHGRDLRYQNGFDCQGLWVEVEVEKEKGFTTKDEIEAYGIEKFIQDCKDRVYKFADIISNQSIRLGMWMDWNDSYFTMSEENNYAIWGFLKKCHERGKIYSSTDVMPWSGRSGCAYSQMEVVEGRKLVAHTALFVKFPIIGREKENLLVWTTTPWTLTSNVAVAVNKDLEYVKIKSLKDEEVYYFAAENLKFQRLDRQFREKKEWVDGVPKLKTLHQIFTERGGYEIIEIVKGADLIGLKYQGPFDELEAQNISGGFPFTNDSIAQSAREAHQVIDGGSDSHGNPTVVAGEGTGMVHIAPGCGDIDHEIGRKLGLPALAPLDEAATFLGPFGFLKGLNAIADDTKALILKNLDEKGILVATEQYPHVYPHCWRTGVELVFRMVDEWYINMDWRDEIKKVVHDIQWIPGWGKERELEWLTNMRDWMISKKRYWGLALPIWICEDCGHFDVIGSKEELKEKAIEGLEQMEGHTPHRPFIDFVKIACPTCHGKAHRVPDVGNPWLDAGIVPYSTIYYFQDREKWKKWVPVDLVLECFPGQFRNWFYSLLAISTMMENIAPFKTLFGHALVRDEKGEEMHKSQGNAIWFDDAAEKAGADLMRWLFTRQEPTTNVNFGYNVLSEIRGKFVNTLWNAYAFYINYSRIVGFVPSEVLTPFDERPEFDRWIITELQDTIDKCTWNISEYRFRIAALTVENFVENLSNWYIRHNRRRFWQMPAENKDALMAFETLFECIDKITRLIAPIMPFITEKMFQNMIRTIRKDAPESIHLTEYPKVDDACKDSTLARNMAIVKKLNYLGLSARNSAKIKMRQPLASLTIGPADQVEYEAANHFSNMLAELLNVKDIIIKDAGTVSPMQYNVKANFKTLGPRFGKDMKKIAAAIEARGEELIATVKAGDDSISLTVEENVIKLQSQDITLINISPEGYAVAEEFSTWVALDTTITDELKVEGLMREILRRIQVLRKEIGLEIEDRVTLKWSSSDDLIGQAFSQFGEFMAHELLALSIEKGESSDEVHTLKIDGQTLTIEIKKAE